MADQNAGKPIFSWDEVSARRLERSGLVGPGKDVPAAEMVRAMCGAHAQVMSAAELSIGLRAGGITRQAVREALWVEHSLIKTHGPRGTVHLLPAQDLGMWCGALSALPYALPNDPRNEILNPEQAEAVVEGIGTALADADLTTDKLTEALVDLVGAWAGEKAMPAFQDLWPRWRKAQSYAAARGVLCFGPNRGRNVTYTNPRRWLPGFQLMPPEQALAGVVRQFLTAYGPATPNQFAQWLAMPGRWAVELFDSLASEIQQVVFEGSTAWVSAGDTAMADAPARGVRLLPYFDAYVIGCQPRERLYPGAVGKRALAGGQAGNFPVVLMDGVVGGVWQQRRAGRKIEITVETMETLTAAQHREIDQQVERMGEILEGRARWSSGTVTVGAHA